MGSSDTNGKAPGAAPAPEGMVNLVIDGKTLTVPKGTNLIDAAASAGIEIPHYCYHPNLSIAGNCRMCQVRIKGMPKMEIACNTTVKEGMEVQTHNTSKEVADTQAAVLEFILINHPLDCTVCDQAGHCKLQDYHYEYNARPSRFLEEKEHKVKAVPLGPTVMLDGERCIMCTRCIRFCDEVTGTSELGMLNRGDRSVIAVSPGKELDNPLSGTVVDLCPVGALTHRNWRFNTRIWFTKHTDAICPGCSTGCNVRVHERDGQVVNVKARVNQQVNKEWLCDEGRYGFHRFLPPARLKEAHGSAGSGWQAALSGLKAGFGGKLAVFISPDLLVEDFALLKELLAKAGSGSTVAMAYRGRGLTAVEKILISPDYAANFRGAEFAGLVPANGENGAHQSAYENALQRVAAKEFDTVLIIGDRAVLPGDQSEPFLAGLRAAKLSIGVLCDAESKLAQAVQVALPGRSILEKSGLMVNRAGRLQYTTAALPLVEGTEPDWRVLLRIAEALGIKGLSAATSDRERTLELLASDSRLRGLSIARIKSGGVPIGGAECVCAAGGLQAAGAA